MEDLDEQWNKMHLLEDEEVAIVFDEAVYPTKESAA